MDVKATSAMHVIKKEDKQSILRAFISQDLEARRKDPSLAIENNTYYVVARSPLSPVALALAELADEITACGITIYAVFTASGTQATRPSAGQGQHCETSTTRQIQDVRLLDAHELLLLGSGTAWVGDCMRRDPAQNDAYERYSNGCASTAICVRSSFKHLWNGARPLALSWLAMRSQDNPSVLVDDEVIAGSSVHPLAEQSIRTPSTRH